MAVEQIPISSAGQISNRRQEVVPVGSDSEQSALASIINWGDSALSGLNTSADTYFRASELKNWSSTGWSSLKSTGKYVGRFLSGVTGINRVFDSLEQDIAAGSKLYERTAMAIPLSVAQIAGSAWAGSAIAAGAGSVLGTTAAVAGTLTLGGAILAGAATVGTGYLIGRGIDAVQQWMNH